MLQDWISKSLGQWSSLTVKEQWQSLMQTVTKGHNGKEGIMDSKTKAEFQSTIENRVRAPSVDLPFPFSFSNSVTVTSPPASAANTSSFHPGSKRGRESRSPSPPKSNRPYCADLFPDLSDPNFGKSGDTAATSTFIKVPQKGKDHRITDINVDDRISARVQ